jgi:hypothetical protein
MAHGEIAVTTELVRRNIKMVVIICKVDSTIVDFSSYSGVEFQTSLNVLIVVSFFIIYVTSSTMLLKSVRNIVSKYAYKPAPQGLRYLYAIIIATQILTCIVILIIIFQMLILDKYSLIFLEVQTYISHISALVFLSFLVFLFGGWLASKRNYIVLLYTISFSLAAVNLVVVLIYLESYFSIFSTVLYNVTPFPITS